MDSIEEGFGQFDYDDELIVNYKDFHGTLELLELNVDADLEDFLIYFLFKYTRDINRLPYNVDFPDKHLGTIEYLERRR